MTDAKCVRYKDIVSHLKKKSIGNTKNKSLGAWKCVNKCIKNEFVGNNDLLLILIFRKIYLYCSADYAQNNCGVIYSVISIQEK